VARGRSLLRDLEGNPALPTCPMGSLTVALRQLALIAKALSWEPKVMIFDEPTAILTQREADTLFGIIRKLRGRGVGIIYISHRLEEVFKIADRVTVLKDGENKGTWPVGAAGTADHERGEGAAITKAQLIEVMAGRALLQSVAHGGPRAAEPVLAVRGLTHRGMYQDVRFDLRPGKEESLAQRYVRALSIKTPNTRVKVANLSGGNQQKVVLAKWLAAQPRIFILDEPTAGIDVSSKQQIHNLIAGLATEGVAIM